MIYVNSETILNTDLFSLLNIVERYPQELIKSFINHLLIYYLKYILY